MKNKAIIEKNISCLPKNHCYGCGACDNICPVNCIQMQFDIEGFSYPKVNENDCISCRKCVEVCPGYNDASTKEILDEPIIFGGQILNQKIRLSSSSGGIFSLVAEKILNEGGIVYGASYDYEKMKVYHKRCISIIELRSLRKSKYVQSEINTTFSEVKRDLQNSNKVFFTGTPCQIEGLLLFLDQVNTNLFTCDIICHGVPSPRLFYEHFTSLEKHLNEPIELIDFRTKQKGWGTFLDLYLNIKTESKTILTYAPLDAYYALFLANLTLRPCCYEYKYTSFDRKSDLTLGDFWGVKKEFPELFDGKGTSLIVVNTNKGLDLIKSASSDAKLIKVKRLKNIPPNLQKPTKKPKFRDSFFNRVILQEWDKFRVISHVFALFSILKTKFDSAIERVSL